MWDAKRKPLGITQDSVADDFGWTQGAVSAYLNGWTPLNLPAAIKFARVLECTVAEIWDGDPSLLAFESVLTPEQVLEVVQAAFTPQEQMDLGRQIFEYLAQRGLDGDEGSQSG